MTILSREDWTKQTIAQLEAFCAGRRSGPCSRSSNPDATLAHLPSDRGIQAGAPGVATPPCTESVKTYPDLSAHCLKERLDLPLRLWYLLRQAGGRGWFLRSEVYKISCSNRRQTNTWLRAGIGTFWHWAGDRLYLHGLAKLCQSLAIKPRKRPVYIAQAEVENLAHFRAALFASWFADAGQRGRVITQAKLAEIFGRTDRTIRTWAKSAGLGLDVVHNIALAPVPAPGDDLGRYPLGTLEALGWGKSWLDNPGDKPNLVWFERHDDNLVLVWKMANTYISTLATGPKTTLQKQASRHAPDKEAAGAPGGKLYYRNHAEENGRAIARAMQRGGALYLETGAVHPKSGAHLWSYLT